MQRLEVSGAVRPIYGSLGVKRLRLSVLPYPPSLFLDVPTSDARCLHARNDAREPSSERWKCMGENVPVILPK